MADAAGSDITVLGLGLDTSDAEEGAERFAQSTDKVGSSAEEAGAALDKLGEQGGASLKELSASAYEMRSAFQEVTESVRRGIEALGVSFGAFAGAEALRGANEVAQRYDELGAVMVRVGQYAGASAQQINELQRQLQGMGVGSESARQAIVRMQQANISLADATRLTAAAQNVAVASGRDLDDTLQLLVRAASSGSSFVLRQVGLNIDWKKSTDELAASLHKTPAELSEQEKAQARLNAVIQATLPINGAWDASMETSAGMMRRLGAQAQEAKVQLGETISPALVAALRLFSAVLSEITDHMVAFLTVTAGVAARAIAPMVARLLEATAAQGRLVVAMALGETTAQAYSARVDALVAAELLEARTADQVAAAEARQVLALEAEVAAAESASIASRALSLAQAGMAALGGVVGVALIAISALMVHYGTEVSAATKLTQDQSVAWQEGEAAAKGFAQQLQAVAAAHGQANEAGVGTEAQMKAKASLAQAQQEIAEVAGASGGILPSLQQLERAKDFVEHPWDTSRADDAMQGLAQQFQAGAINVDQLRSKLLALAEQYPGQIGAMQAFARSVEAAAAAEKDLAGARGPQAPASVPEWARAQSTIPGIGVDKQTEQLQREIAEARTKSAAAPGGKEAEDAATRQVEAVQKATAAYEAWNKEQANTIAQQVPLQSILKATDQQISEQAKAFTSGAAGSPEWLATYQTAVKSLVDARTAAKGYMEQAGDLERQLKLLADTERAASQAREDKNLKADIADTQQLTAAVGQNAAQYHALEDALKGQRAARELPEGTSDAERKARGGIVTQQATAEDLLKGRQQQQAVDQQIADAQRLAAAAAQGEEATLRTTRELAAEKAARDALTGGLQAYVASLILAASESLKAYNTTTSGLERQIADTTAMAQATLRGSSAVADLTAKQGAETDAVTKGFTAEQQHNDELLRRQKITADADLSAAKDIETMQRQTALLEGQAKAQADGTEASKEYQVWLAGETAVLEHASNASQDYQNQIRAVAEAQERARQDVADVKTEEKPLKAAQQAMQGDFATFFTDLVGQGHNAWLTLWNDLRDTFLKAIGEMLAEDLFGDFAKKAFEQGRQAAQAAPAGGGAGGINPPSFGQSGKFGAQSGLAAGVGGFVAGQGLATTQAGGFGVAAGTVLGAAQGYQLAGPIGAAVGGVAGLVGGLVGLAQSAHQAAEALKQAKIAFDQMLNQFQQLALGGNNLDAILSNLKEQAGALYEAGKKAGWATADQTAGLQNLENLAALNPQQRQAMIDQAKGPGDREKLRREFAEADQIMKELNEAIANSIAEFKAGMADQIQQLTTGVAGDQGQLQQAKEQYEQNVASANALTDATARTQALTQALQLYNLTVKDIEQNEALAVQQQQSEISQFKQNLAARAAAAEMNQGLAAQENLAAQQAQELEQAIQQWSKTNPELITQLQQVQALETAAYNAQQQQAADDLSDQLKARAAAAAGASNQAAILNLQLQQVQELRQATEQWEQTNPQLIAQLKQVQQEEMAQLVQQQKQQLDDEQASLQSRALQAEGFTQQASIVQLIQQQVDELAQATKEWGATNPALIAQLKQVQQIELRTAEQNLQSAEANAVAGYKVAQQVYAAAGAGNPYAPVPGTGTTTPPIGQIPGQVQYQPNIPGVPQSTTAQTQFLTTSAASGLGLAPPGVTDAATAAATAAVNSALGSGSGGALTITGPTQIAINGAVTLSPTGGGITTSGGIAILGGPIGSPGVPANSTGLPVSAAPVAGQGAQAARAAANNPQQTVAARPVVLQLAPGSIVVNGGQQDPRVIADTLIKELQRRAVSLTGQSTDAATVLNTARV